MRKKPELAAIQNYPWIKTYSTPGEGCERMPDGTYSDYGFHSEMLEEDLSPDGRWTDANGNFSLQWRHNTSVFQVGRVSPGLRLMQEAFWCGLFDLPDRM
jgi:hypothetical protein